MAERSRSVPDEIARVALGFYIRQVRDGQKMTQRTLGQRLGISESTVSRIESGRERVSMGRAAEIARVLGIDPAVLMSYFGEWPELTEADLRRIEQEPPQAEFLLARRGGGMQSKTRRRRGAKRVKTRLPKAARLWYWLMLTRDYQEALIAQGLPPGDVLKATSRLARMHGTEEAEHGPERSDDLLTSVAADYYGVRGSLLLQLEAAGFTVAEIAELLDMPESSVVTRIARAKSRTESKVQAG